MQKGDLSMRIDEIEAENFRCLKSVKASLHNLTVFVGRNGSGKSSMLHALDTLFKPKASITEEDFFNRDTDGPIEIKVTFTDFTNEERREFHAFIQNDRMIVTKIISYDSELDRFSEEYFSYESQVPRFAEIREIEGAREKTKALRELIAEGTLDGLDGSPRSEAETLEIMRRFEEEHPGLTELVRTKVHFFGARNIGGGKLDKYTRFIFLPAVKEASEETEGRESSINRLLDVLVLREIENRKDIVSFRDEIIQEVVEKYSPENLGGLDEISNSISETLSRYSPGSGLVLKWNEAEPPQIDLPSVTCDVSEDGFEGCVERKGHGLQRALILTLLEHLALTSAAEELKGDKTEESTDRETLRIDTILAIEEPEIYLHPSRARYLSKILLILAENNGKKSHTQVVYTTHSPYFVGLDRFDDLRLCRKSRDGEEIPCTRIGSYDLESASNRLEEIYGRRRELGNPRDNFKIRSVPVMNAVMNEGFFGDLVVLLEGPSDVGVLWKVQEILKKDWDQRSISLIPTGGKDSIIRPRIIFEGLGIPSFVLFDTDNLTNRTNQVFGRLLKIPGNNLPQEKIHDDWAYNEGNMEDELKRLISEGTYEEIWEQVERELECDDARVRKNPEAMARFIEKVYERGLTLPHYENIVSRITDLHDRTMR